LYNFYYLYIWHTLTGFMLLFEPKELIEV